MKGPLAMAATASILTLGSPAVAQPAGDAAILANRLTGTELIVLDSSSAELGRGGVVSTAIDTCRLNIMWTGGADMSVNLSALGLIGGDAFQSISIRESEQHSPELVFVVGEERYPDALDAFENLARHCGSSPSAPPRIQVVTAADLAREAQIPQYTPAEAAGPKDR